jgi:BTB/POZ domain
MTWLPFRYVARTRVTERLTTTICQVENTHFRVHKHFLVTYSSVFRDLFQRQPSGSSNTSDNDKPNKNDHIIHLDGVTVLEFDSLLTFFYEGCGNVHYTCFDFSCYYSDF